DDEQAVEEHRILQEALLALAHTVGDLSRGPEEEQHEGGDDQPARGQEERLEGGQGHDTDDGQQHPDGAVHHESGLHHVCILLNRVSTEASALSSTVASTFEWAMTRPCRT